MMNGICPKCKEVKEITPQVWNRGCCDECYNRKHTCVICNQLVTDELYTLTGQGNGHKECFELSLDKGGNNSESDDKRNHL